jgi:ABC-type phosphate/phosphonate transport system substrate-binding protein
MIAALPMYDRPETAAANDRLWSLIRDHLRADGHPAPERLHRGGDPWALWQAPDLVLAQTCGLPYRARLHGNVCLVATPDYGVEGCPPGHYRSVLVVRAEDTRDRFEQFDGASLAFNDPMSQSGWAAPLAHAAARGLCLRPVLATGGHRASARAVAEGRAEIAAIDAVSWAMIARWDGLAARLRVLERTSPTPGLPLIAAPGADRTALLAALHAAAAALDAADRESLQLRGMTRIAADAYLAVPLPPDIRAAGGTSAP